MFGLWTYIPSLNFAAVLNKIVGKPLTRSLERLHLLKMGVLIPHDGPGIGPHSVPWACTLGSVFRYTIRREEVGSWKMDALDSLTSLSQSNICFFIR